MSSISEEILETKETRVQAEISSIFNLQNRAGLQDINQYFPHPFLKRIEFPKHFGELEFFIDNISVGRTTQGVLTFPSPETERLANQRGFDPEPNVNYMNETYTDNGFYIGNLSNNSFKAVIHFKDGIIPRVPIPVSFIFVNEYIMDYQNLSGRYRI